MTAAPLSNSLNPRKTPGQSRSEATVVAVLEAAARILETRGLEGYSTNAVARLAGVSIGSLYQYFPNKDAITKALIGRETSALLADVAGIDMRAGGRAGLERLLVLAVEYQLRRPALALLLDLEERRLPIAHDIQSVGEQLVEAFQHCLDASDLLASTRDPAIAQDLLALVKGIVDAAGARGERDAAALRARVRCAVFGYLDGRDAA